MDTSSIRLVVDHEGPENWRFQWDAHRSSYGYHAEDEDHEHARRRVRAVLFPDLVDVRLMVDNVSRPPEWAVSDLVAREGAYIARCSASTASRVAAWAKDRNKVVESLTPADFAWAAALTATYGPTARGVCAVQVTREQGSIRFIAVRAAKVIALRRLPPNALDVTVGSVLESFSELRGLDNRPVLLALGDPEFRARMDAAAATIGYQSITPTEALLAIIDEPKAVAAAFAGAGPRFVPPEVVAAATKRNRRRAVLSALAAVALLVLTAALETLDIHRELAALDTARGAHGTDVAALMDARARATDMLAATTALEAQRASHPRWTLLLGSLSDGLPEGSHLTSLSARGDSLVIEFESSDAAAAFDAVREIPWLRELHSTSPVQREVGEASELTERLTASAVVSWADFDVAASR